MKIKSILGTLFVAAALTFCLAGCGGGASSSDQPSGDDTKKPSKQEQKTYAIGDTWTVPDQWELTVTGVTLTDERNEYADSNPAAVYIVDYTYTNLGYEDSSGIMDGLYIYIDSTIVDSAGMMGYSYPGDVAYPTQVPVGATCKAQACIGVDNAGDFQLTVSEYDSNKEKQKAVFNITVE